MLSAITNTQWPTLLPSYIYALISKIITLKLRFVLTGIIFYENWIKSKKQEKSASRSFYIAVKLLTWMYFHSIVHDGRWIRFVGDAKLLFFFLKWNMRHLMLQGREANEAQEQLSSRRHGHRGVLSLQAGCSPSQALPQTQDGFTWTDRWTFRPSQTHSRHD